MPPQRVVVDNLQLVRLVTDHARKLERLETLGSLVGLAKHDTLLCFDNAVAVHTIGRMRLLPGTGMIYRPVSWHLGANANGSVVVDVLGGTGYPPVTSVCWANRPRLLGQNSNTGVCTGWNVQSFPHGYYLIINIVSYATIAQVGFSLELAPEAA